MPYKFNPLTGEFDFVNSLSDSLKIDNKTNGNNIVLSNGDKIQGITGNSFFNPSYNNSAGVFSLSDTLIGNSNTGKIGIGVSPLTHDLEILSNGVSPIAKFGNTFSDSFFSIDSLGRSHFFGSFGSGGVAVGGNSYSQINNAQLSVHGNLSTSSVLSVGGAGTIGNSISAPNGWTLGLGTSKLIDSLEKNATQIQTKQSKLIVTNSNDTNNTFVFDALGNPIFSIKAIEANSTVNTTTSTTKINKSSYWDGTESITNEESDVFKSDLNGSSSSTKSINGELLLRLNSNQTFDTVAFEVDETDPQNPLYTAKEEVNFRVVKTLEAGVNSTYEFKITKK